MLTVDGAKFEREVWHRRGSPENPVDRREIDQKFDAKVSELLGAKSAEHLRALAANLDNVSNANEIIGIPAFVLAIVKAMPKLENRVCTVQAFNR